MKPTRESSVRACAILVIFTVLMSTATIGVGSAAKMSTAHPNPTTSVSSESTSVATTHNKCGVTGGVESATRSGRVGEVKVVKPVSLTDVENPESTTKTFAELTRLLNLSQSDQDTALVLVPPEDAKAAGWATGNTFCLSGQSRYIWDGLIVHEYVHTRQDFSVSSDMHWIVEASAFYYMAIVPYQRGTMSEQRASERVYSDRGGVLTTSEDYGLYAARGPTVLAALDHEIRDRTDGSKTLENVLQEMNKQNQDVTYSRFKDIVADVAGERLDSWLDKRVDGDTSISSEQIQVQELTLTADAASPNFQISSGEILSNETRGASADTFRLNITEGEQTPVSVLVRNKGGVSGRQDVRMFVINDSAGDEMSAGQNGSIVFNYGRQVSLNSGGSETVSFPTDEMRSLESGKYDISIQTGDHKINGTLTVHEPSRSEDAELADRVRKVAVQIKNVVDRFIRGFTQ